MLTSFSLRHYDSIDNDLLLLAKVQEDIITAVASQDSEQMFLTLAACIARAETLGQKSIDRQNSLR